MRVRVPLPVPLWGNAARRFPFFLAFFRRRLSEKSPDFRPPTKPGNAPFLKHLIVIGGPTASGKTALAIRLAQHFGTEILSADSRQFYREMNVGTAKPTAEELAAAPHHFINSLSINELYTVGDFERDALALLSNIFETRNVAIVVGGSGLFIRALCEGLDEFPAISEEVKLNLQADFQANGLPFLQAELQEFDPETASKIDLHNPARLLRALAVCRASGLPYSSFLKKEKAERPFQPHFLLTDWPRAELYQRIEKRVDSMIADGLENEARQLIPFQNLTALQTVGYSEFFQYFDEKISLPDCIYLIKQHSRNYAKRQLTWFRKEQQWQSFHPENWPTILEFLNQKMGRVQN